MATMEVEKDDIEAITWYSPILEVEKYDLGRSTMHFRSSGYKTAVYLYMGKKERSVPFLRWKIRYYGDRWLFIRRYRIKIDQEEARTLLPTAPIKRDTSGGSVWETFDEPANKHAPLLNQMLASKTTYLRMEGTGGVEDIELGPEHLQRMRNVLLVYRYLGGVWPAN